MTAVVSGITGPILTIALAGGCWALARKKSDKRAVQALVAVAGVSATVAAAVLSKGPWRSPDGYLGHSLWVQLPALVAVIAVGLSALWTLTMRQE